MNLHRLVEGLAAKYAEGDFKSEAAAAREEYLERGGKVFDDDAELFEARMASFLEWYVIERPLAGGTQPVLRELEAGVGLPPEERRELAQLATSHRSLFDLIGISGGLIELEDVLGGARFAVSERRSTIGFTAGDVFEARLLSDGKSVVFGKTFLFHPRDARDQVLDAVAAALASGMSRQDVMFHLSRLHVRWHRYRHVPAARIYAGEM